MITTFQQWPKELRMKRGLLNGERVKMAREVRGMTRAALARKLGIPAKTLAQREAGWNFWEDNEQTGLSFFTDFPIAFFTQQDPPLLSAPIFMCGHDEEGHSWCEVETT